MGRNQSKNQMKRCKQQMKILDNLFLPHSWERKKKLKGERKKRERSGGDKAELSITDLRKCSQDNRNNNNYGNYKTAVEHKWNPRFKTVSYSNVQIQNLRWYNLKPTPAVHTGTRTSGTAPKKNRMVFISLWYLDPYMNP